MDTKPILSLAELRALFDVRETITKNDERYKRLNNIAAISLEIGTGRYFTEQTFVEHLTTRDNTRTDYDFRGSSDFALPTSGLLDSGLLTRATPTSVPLLGVNVDPATLKVWYNPAARGPDDFEDQHALEMDRDFQLDPETDRLHLYIATRFRVRSLRVEYTAGYAAAEVDNYSCLSAAAPMWLKEAAMLQVQFLNIKLRNDNIAMAAERTVSDKGRVASSAFLKVNGLTPEVVPLVAHLRRPGMGRG